MIHPQKHCSQLESLVDSFCDGWSVKKKFSVQIDLDSLMSFYITQARIQDFEMGGEFL